MFSQRRDGTPILIGSAATRLQRVATEAGSPETFDEAWLQDILHRYPECLPMQEIEPGLDRLVAICREMPTPRGPVDNLFMTGRGDIVLAEAKLWRNPEARRQVVAQSLDYATAIFGMSYQEFEAAALKGLFGSKEKPRNLHALFGEDEALAEPEFIEAVTLNLRRGRLVVLVVGDGIRSEAERLTDGLQSHAGFHFTFALVEMAVFRMPEEGSVVIVPRTLAKTVMIERGILRFEGSQPRIEAPRVTTVPSAAPSSITSEQFFEAMAARDLTLPERLRSFIDRLEPIGVYPDFQRSLIFRWDPPKGKPITLGYIQRNGAVWTDTVHLNAPIDLSQAYVSDLAQAWGCTVDRESIGQNWQVRTAGSPPKIETIASRLDASVPVIERFITAIRERLAREPS
jgi:hypothetical protein